MGYPIIPLRESIMKFTICATLIFSVCGFLNAQDLTLNIPGFSYDYVVPVDTISREIYIEQDFMNWNLDEPPFSIEIHFHNPSSRPMAYTFAGFTQGNFIDALDSLGFSVTSFSEIDSFWTGVFETPNGLAQGVRYLDMPGDTISGISLTFSSELVSYDRYYLSLWYKADTVSDWSRFQPLAVGNIWKFAGAFPLYNHERLEVIDASVSGDTTIYTVHHQREYDEDYGIGIIEDTAQVYTVSDEPYQIRRYSGPYLNTLIMDFRPAFDPPIHWMIEGIVPRGDGTVDYGSINLQGGFLLWQAGVGFHLSMGAPIGTISELIGYYVGDEEWGDIDILVGIADLPQIPNEYQLTAYPNPFNPATTIRYAIPENNKVTIDIFDQLGRHVNTLVNTQQNHGEHKVQWNGTDSAGRQLCSGLYLCQIRSGTFSKTLKLLLLK